MTHKLILKFKKFQLSSANRFDTVEETPPGRVDSTTPIPFRVKDSLTTLSCETIKWLIL